MIVHLWVKFSVDISIFFFCGQFVRKTILHFQSVFLLLSTHTKELQMLQATINARKPSKIAAPYYACVYLVTVDFE